MVIWDFNLRHLRAAATISRLGSVSAAADAVHLTQPAITQALARLEGQLGQPLFLRRPDGMEPTPAAMLLVPRIDAAMAQVASQRVTMPQLRALIALADAGSYAAASAQTGLAQPSLHRAIADLSLVLRRDLVERRGRGIALTAQGRRLVRSFRLARAELVAGLSELAALDGVDAGQISVGAMPLSRARLLPSAVAAFHRAHPQAGVRIMEGSFAELVEPLRDGDLDILLGALREPLPAPDLVQRRLFDDRPVIVGRYAHPLASTAMHFGRLPDYPWILPGTGTPLRQQWERMFMDRGLTLPPVPVECGSVMTIRQILMDSNFLTLLSPDQLAVELDAGLLVRICDAPPGLVRTIGMTTRADWRPTRMQGLFIDLLAETADEMRTVPKKL